MIPRIIVENILLCTDGVFIKENILTPTMTIPSIDDPALSHASDNRIAHFPKPTTSISF